MKKITLFFNTQDVVGHALIVENGRRYAAGEAMLTQDEENDWYERASRVVKGNEDCFIDVYENGRYEIQL